MKIYTRTGDEGQTGLFAGPRVSKDDVRIEAYGAVDELNAVIGWARAEGLPADIDAWLNNVQNELFAVGSELATPEPGKHGTAMLGEQHTGALERAIDKLEEELPPLRVFILPGGGKAAAVLHVARTVCRRAERRVVTLAAQQPIDGRLVRYLNRLSDFLFVVARAANSRQQLPDVPWEKPTAE